MNTLIRRPRSLRLTALAAGCLLCFLALATGSGQAEEVAPQRIFLSNGIEVLLLPDAACRVVTAVAVIKAGASHEDARLSGASHFLEHMLFNGTTRRTQKQLYDEEDSAGGFNNAFTRRTHAAFMMTMPSAQLELALDLQADMLFESRLPAQKFEKERGIILEELAKDKDSESYDIGRVLERESFPKSSYGMPVLGSELSIRELSRDEVWDYYKAHYVPENMQLLLMGGFDPQEARRHLEDKFGSIRPAGGAVPVPKAPEPIEADRLIRHTLPISQLDVRLLWNAPSPSEPGYLALEAATSLLTSGTNSPLYISLEKSLPGQVLSCGGAITGGPGFGRLQLDLSFAADTDPKEALAAIRRAIGELPLPSSDRLAGWKTSEKSSQIFARQRSYMFAPLYSEEIALRGLWGIETRLERVSALTPEMVSEAAGTLFEGPRWEILLVPEDGAEAATSRPGVSGMAGMPGMPQMEAGEMDGDRKPGGQAPAAPESGDVEPLSISALAVNQLPLTNGSQLLLLDAPADGSLAIYVLIEGRNYLEPPGQEGITELLHGVLSAGPRGMSEAEFQNALAGIGAEMQTADRGFIPFDDYYTSPDFSFIRLQALDEHAEKAFELLGRMLRTPALDEQVVEREKNRLVGRLSRDAGSARQSGSRKVSELLYGEGHPMARSAFGQLPGAEQIERDDLSAYHELLLDPRRIWIGVVSGHSPERLAEWAENLLPSSGPDSPTLGMTPDRFELWEARSQLGDLLRERFAAMARAPAGHDLSEYAPPARFEGQQTQGGRVLAAQVQTGGEGRSYVVETLLIDPQKKSAAGSLPSAALQDHLSGALRVAAGLLSSQLAFHLREERGLAYGIGASIYPVGDCWVYRAGAETRGENVDEMAAGFVRLRRAAGAAGADPIEARRIANKQFGRTLRRQEMRLNQAMYSVWAAREGKDPLSWWTEAEELPQVAPEVVSEALRVLAEMEPAILLIAE